MRVYLLSFIVSLLTIFPAAADSSVASSATIATAASKLPAIQPADVRLLIDVSGSMKRTDPHNLRKPAMELLVQLLPEGSRAGIWSFGESSLVLALHQSVDRNWRTQAAENTSGINSNALLTHIGAALDAAAYDIATPKTSSALRKQIILLTDGMVDIAASADVNAQERNRVLTELLPKLQQAGYVIHTIALSDEADADLMEKISLTTDGVFVIVKNADQLLSAFLRIFDSAVPLIRLPLANNHFMVDAAVEEFTALIFRNANAQATELITPDSKSYTAANAMGKVVWYKAAAYDLITVTNPTTGEWQINADLDVNNRVTVVSNLKLDIATLKNNIEVSQTLELLFSFRQDDQTIVDPRFLQLLDMDVIVTRTRDGKQWQIPLVNTNPPIDGIYHHPLELFRETGKYDVQLLIDGKTFKREFKHQVTVGSPFSVTMERGLHNNRVAYHLRVNADDQRVDNSKTAIVAQVKDSTGASAMSNFELTEQGEWQLWITPDKFARYSVSLQVSGLRRDGEPVKEILATQYFTFPEQGDPEPAADWEEPVIVISDAEPANLPVLPSNESITEPESAIVVDHKPVAPKTTNKWLLYLSIGMAHIFVFGLAFFAYRMIFGKQAKTETAEHEDTLSVNVESIAAQKQAAASMLAAANTASTIDLAEDNSMAELDVTAVDTTTNDFDDFLAADDFGSVFDADEPEPRLENDEENNLLNDSEDNKDKDI